MITKINEAVNFIRRVNNMPCKIGIVLGSGLGSFTAEMDIEKEIPYYDIPHFPASTVEGHSGKLIFGEMGGKKVVAMAGRLHYYEGYATGEVVFPIRVLKFLGIETLLISNAAGGMNAGFKVGDLMVIKDHISLFTLLAVVTSFLISLYGMANTPDQNNPALKYMPYIFPFMLLFMFNGLPSALTWYYTVSNVITLVLQWVIQNYIINHEKILVQLQENRKKPKSESKWQERLEQMQETQKRVQETQTKNKGK